MMKDKKLKEMMYKIDDMLVKEETSLADSSNIFLTMLCTSLSEAKIKTEDVKKIIDTYLDKYQKVENNNWQ